MTSARESPANISRAAAHEGAVRSFALLSAGNLCCQGHGHARLTLAFVLPLPAHSGSNFNRRAARHGVALPFALLQRYVIGMSPRYKTMIGGIILIVMMALYALVAVTVASARWLIQAGLFILPFLRSPACFGSFRQWRWYPGCCGTIASLSVTGPVAVGHQTRQTDSIKRTSPNILVPAVSDMRGSAVKAHK